MISHSPPIFSHSPPVSFLSDYMNNHRQHIPFHDDHSRTSIYCRPQMMTLASKVIVNNATAAAGQASPQRTMRGSSYGGRGACLDRMSSVPLMPVQPKSCLSRRATNNAANNNNNKYATTDAHSSAMATASAATAAAAAATGATTTGYKCNEQSRRHKKVSFADDEGLSLTEVRVMSEPSNVPPYWSVKFLEQITQGLVSPQPADQWTVDFKQPASDYLSFRQKIESEYVSLENVIVKDEESIIVGTVKVKNIDFEKEVIVRVTWDDWKSQQDIFCTYARAYGPATCAHVVFDTFSFKVTLPPSSKRLEFCICFRANELEYWDNNDNKNYTISKRSPFYYNALSPYVGNSSTTASSRNNNNSCQTQLNNKMSTLSEALAHANENQSPNSHHYNPAPSPYW